MALVSGNIHAISLTSCSQQDVCFEVLKVVSCMSEHLDVGQVTVEVLRNLVSFLLLVLDFKDIVEYFSLTHNHLFLQLIFLSLNSLINSLKYVVSKVLCKDLPGNFFLIIQEVLVQTFFLDNVCVTFHELGPVVFIKTLAELKQSLQHYDDVSGNTGLLKKLEIVVF